MAYSGGRRATDTSSMARFATTLEFLAKTVDEIRSDIKEMKSDTAARLAMIENGKLSKEEAAHMKEEGDKIHANIQNAIDAIADIVQKLKDRQTYWLGGLAVINILFGIAVAVALKLF